MDGLSLLLLWNIPRASAERNFKLLENILGTRAAPAQVGSYCESIFMHPGSNRKGKYHVFTLSACSLSFKDRIPLDKFLEAACPYVNVIEKSVYADVQGWMFQYTGTALLVVQDPNRAPLPAEMLVTNLSVNDVVQWCCQALQIQEGKLSVMPEYFDIDH